MAVNGNNFLIKLFEKNCQVGRKPARKRPRKPTIQEWVKQNNQPEENYWLTGAEQETLAAAFFTYESEEQAKLGLKFSNNNNCVQEEPEFERDMDKINALLEDLKEDPGVIELDKKFERNAEKFKKRITTLSQKSTNLGTQNTNWAALSVPEAKNYPISQSSFQSTTQRQSPSTSTFDADKIWKLVGRPDIFMTNLGNKPPGSGISLNDTPLPLPVPSIVTELPGVSSIPEDRETPSENQEPKTVASSPAKNNDHVQKEPEFEGDMDTSLFDSDKMLSENKSITPGKSPNHEQLPLPSIEIELQEVSEVRETPSGSHERASVVIFPEPLQEDALLTPFSEDTSEVEKPISFRTYAKGNKQSVEPFTVDEIRASREFVRFFPILPESLSENESSSAESDHESSQLLVFPKTVKLDRFKSKIQRSSAPKTEMKENQKDEEEFADEENFESDACTKKIYLRAYVKTKKPDTEEGGIIVEGTSEDPFDPNSEWFTLTEVPPSLSDHHEEHQSQAEGQKRLCKHERDLPMNRYRPKRRRIVANENALVISHEKREIAPEHRNIITRGKAWLETQNEDRPMPTVYPPNHRLNNSRLHRILGDDDDEYPFRRQIQPAKTEN